MAGKQEVSHEESLEVSQVQSQVLSLVELLVETLEESQVDSLELSLVELLAESQGESLVQRSVT
jgi:hypothetical protein